MAILIIEHQGRRQAGTLKGRVLIGRWPDNTVVIEDKAVSRIHGWIGVQDGRFYIADAGSRTGTFINGELLRERHVLNDGDQIQVGPALLKYRTDPAPPADVDTIDLTPRTAADLSGPQGIFMDCVCGAPLWLPREFSGVGQCRYCGHIVTQNLTPPTPMPVTQKAAVAIAPAPTPKPAAAMPAAEAKRQPPRPAAAPPAAAPAFSRKEPGEKICGICQSPITLFDEVATCSSCALAFHADCWTENQGCSAYGCSQVGALKGK